MPTWGDRRRTKIGLLGGSFNPAHAGHRHIARLALRTFGLDQIWLLVSPGNPLKPVDGMASLTDRLASARAIAGHDPNVIATTIEARLGTRYTVHTLRMLRTRFPNAKFVWLMGADNLAQLPRWHGWREIVRTMPFAVLPRPAYNLRARAGLAAHRLPALPGGRPRRRPPRRPTSTRLVVSRPAASIRDRPPPSAAPSLHPYRSNPAIARKPTTPPASPTNEETPRPPRKRAVAKGAVVVTTTPPKPGTPRKKAAAAGPRAKAEEPARPPRERAEADRLDQLQGIIVESLEADKAEGVLALDLAGRASFADRMVIATGLADRQIAAMATHLEERLHEAGLKRIQIEGANGSDWVLIDAGDIIIHLFKPDARALYGLERMWGPDLDPEPQDSATPA